MDAVVMIVLLAEAALCLLLLYFDGLLHKPAQLFTAVALVVLAIGIRCLCLSYETLDYQTFLAHWVTFFRENGGFSALSQSVGNYNIPYLVFLAAFSYVPMDDLYLIKLLSILFDIILAWSAMRLVSHFTSKVNRQLFCFFAVLLLPTVVLNGALWGQCDSIYAAFAILSVYLALEDRPAMSMVCIAVSFAFKLQAVFVMPLFLILLITRRVRLWHFLLFPVTYLILCLPAIFAGRPILDTVLLYFNQAGSVGDGLNYNSPSVYAFRIFGDASNASLASALGIAAAALLILGTAFWFFQKGGRGSDHAVLAAAALFSVGIPFLLPHMHDRYFFIADIITLCFAVIMPEYFALPALCQFASLLGYHAYLKMRYLLPMGYGAVALIVVLTVLFIFLHAQMNYTRRRNSRT